MIFILDNFDSFTFNLYQYFGELGENVITRRRDACTIEEIESLQPELIVISPGPCAPRDAELTLKVIDYFQGKIPILGVCLGHQAIGEVFGAEVVRAKKPVHGKVSAIRHDGLGVFHNLPNPLTVTRYHSLALKRETLPEELIITAQSEDGEIMGVRHRHLPLEGVQFHPEAILTQSGHELLDNAIHMARAWWKEKQLVESPWLLKELPIGIPPYRLLPALRNCPDPFFLDSGRGYEELGRYSFLGAYPFLKASANRKTIELEWPVLGRSETIENEGGDSLTVLDDLLGRFQITNPTPFPFAGGAVGYFSYDLKNEIEKLPQKALDELNLPLWRFAWYDGILAYDHKVGTYHLLACGMTESGECNRDLAEERIARLENLLLDQLAVLEQPENSRESLGEKDQPVVVPSVAKEDYLQDLQTVIDYIYAGDIYQANLTQRFRVPCTEDPFALYARLHEYNPAPFAAFLYYPDFQILSSSPERFIRIEAEGEITACPIKGTRPRGHNEEEDQRQAQELMESDKDRAELTMIIDLERNDLGRICQYGTVRVTDLIRLEKYPTVWHLVSTIAGMLKPGLKASQILQAIYPGGSITGAPKIRAMEIIDEVEPYTRGFYTGSIGYLGFDGAWDLNIVIRTILLKEGQAYFHGGGGIVADSVPLEEYQESLQKVKAMMRVLGGSLA